MENANQPAIYVVDADTGAVQTLGLFVEFYLSHPSIKRYKVTGRIHTNEQVVACRQIYRSLVQGNVLMASDVRHLSLMDLQMIQREGDDYLHKLTQRIARTRSPRYGREVDPERPRLYVVDPHTKASVGLVQFVRGLLLDSPKAPTMDLPQSLANHVAEVSLLNMRESLARDQPFKAEDIQSLTPLHWLKIWQQGDSYIYALLKVGDLDDPHILERVMRRENDEGMGRERTRDPEWDDICCRRNRYSDLSSCFELYHGCPVRERMREAERLRERERGGMEYGR